MRNGTKIGLILIALAWLAGSTGVSIFALKAALRSKGQGYETGEPMRHVVPSAYRAASADI